MRKLQQHPQPETEDRKLYRKVKICQIKAYYPDYAGARTKNQFVYACTECKGFHRTSRPIDAENQVRLIERIFGKPVTPALVTAFQEMQAQEINQDTT